MASRPFVTSALSTRYSSKQHLRVVLKVVNCTFLTCTSFLLPSSHHLLSRNGRAGGEARERGFFKTLFPFATGFLINEPHEAPSSEFVRRAKQPRSPLTIENDLYLFVYAADRAASSSSTRSETNGATFLPAQCVPCWRGEKALFSPPVARDKAINRNAKDKGGGGGRVGAEQKAHRTRGYSKKEKGRRARELVNLKQVPRPDRKRETNTNFNIDFALNIIAIGRRLLLSELFIPLDPFISEFPRSLGGEGEKERKIVVFDSASSLRNLLSPQLPDESANGHSKAEK